MNEAFAGTIATLQQHLQKQEDEVRATKRLINQLCQRDGTQPLYPDAESEAPSLSNMRRDQFYGLSLGTAIRKYLEMRRSMGPATVSDIFTALVTGGFKFDAKNDANAKRSLYIALGKNTHTFHKLPGATDDAAVFGLLEWYPNVKAGDPTKKEKPKKKAKKTAKAQPKSKIANPEQAVSSPPGAKPALKTNEPPPAEAVEKGVSHVEEGKGAGSAARKKHSPIYAA